MQKKLQNVLDFPIKSLKYSKKHDLLIIIDKNCNLEFLDIDTYDFPTNLGFELMSDTDFMSIIDQQAISFGFN
jgi:hypothetical protein